MTEEFQPFIDGGTMFTPRPAVPRDEGYGEIGPGVLWYMAWQVLLLLSAFAGVILLGLILHCCLHRDANGALEGKGPLPLNESLSVVLGIDHPPIEVFGTVNAVIDQPLTVNGSVQVEGTVSTDLPLGACSANESLCVSLATDAAPIDVNIINANFTVNATIDPIVQTEIIGPFGGECDANSSLCVSLPPNTAVVVANESLSVTLDEPIEVLIINPHPLPVVLENVTFSDGSVTIANETLTVTLDGVTTGAQCSLNESLCVSLAQDGPLQVTVPPGEALPVVLQNESLAVDPITLDGVSVGGECLANSSLCVSLAQDGPLQVTVPPGEALPVVLQNESLAVDPITLDGVSVGGECSANSSLCVSLAQDAPLNVTLGNQPVQVINAPGDTLLVEIANLTFTIDPIINITSSVNANISGPLGTCDPADAVCVNIVGPTGANTPKTDAIAVTFTNDAPPLVVQQSRNTTDLFGRTRVTNARGLFDFKTLNAVSEVLNFNDAETSGSGTSVTFSADMAAIIHNVSDLTSGTHVRQSLRRFNYQPGNVQVIYMTVRPDLTNPGIVKRWGYFDERNGLFFEVRGNNEFYAVVRSSASGAPVDTAVDITGAFPGDFSLLDVTLWDIEFAWMGAVNIRFAIREGASTVILYETIDPLQEVWSSMPNLPIRVEISNNGTGMASSMLSTAFSVRTEGASEPSAQPYSVDREDTRLSITSDGLLHALIGVRLRIPDYISASAILNNIAHVALRGNVIYRWALLYRPTIAGEVPVWTSRPESPLESAAPSAAATCSGGQQFASGYVIGTSQTSGGSSNVPPQIYLGSLIDHTPLELWLCVERYDTGGSSDDILGGFGMIVAF